MIGDIGLMLATLGVWRIWFAERTGAVGTAGDAIATVWVAIFALDILLAGAS